MTNYDAYLGMCPAEDEAKAVKELLDVMAALSHVRHAGVHILNLVSISALNAVMEASKTMSGLKPSCSTAAHYLYFSASDVDDGDTRFKCSPPIRDEANQNLLLEALVHDAIPIVTSSHFPTLPEFKADCHDFIRAMPGATSLGYLWVSGIDLHSNSCGRFMPRAPSFSKPPGTSPPTPAATASSSK
jgi:allantoinase